MSQVLAPSEPCLQRSALLLWAASALCGVVLCAVPAHAATIVADGGFESAGGGNTYYSGQSIDGGSWSVLTGAVYIDSLDPYVFDGMNSLNLTAANLYVSNTLAEVIATVSGQKYNVSFYGDADSANSFSLTENGISMAGAPGTIAQKGFPGAVSNSALFTLYTASFTANSNSTTLNLSGSASPAIGSQFGSVVIDDFSIQAAPTPEPGSIVLTLTGLLGLGQTLRRKRA